MSEKRLSNTAFDERVLSEVLHQFGPADQVERCFEALKRSIVEHNKSNSNRLLTAVRNLEEELVSHVRDDVVTGELELAAGTKVADARVPWTESDCMAFQYQFEDAMLGVEGRGDVMDPSLRRTKELPAMACNLPDALLRFEFPEVRQRILDELCPTAMTIKFQAYKVLLYRPGDFFAPHVDTMRHKNHFGTLALEIPLAADALESAGLKDPGAEESIRSSSGDDGERAGGDLCFYPGRSVDPGYSGSASDALRNKASHSKDYLPDTDEESGLIRCSLRSPTPLTPEGRFRVRFAAWLSDVPHEVQRVRVGYKATLVYNMFKEGERPLRIPRPLEIHEATRRLFTELAAARLKSRVIGLDEQPVRNLCILLRHTYPPSALHPGALKGVDAVAWEVMSSHCHCVLLSGIEHRVDVPAVPFRVGTLDRDATYGQLLKTVVVPQEGFPALSQAEATSESTKDILFNQHPTLVNSIWLQLGIGLLLGGGHSYGNASCGADWWYRQAVLVVSHYPSHWRRRRMAFLLALRGPDTFRCLFSVWDVFQHVVLFI